MSWCVGLFLEHRLSYAYARLHLRLAIAHQVASFQLLVNVAKIVRAPRVERLLAKRTYGEVAD